MTRDPRSWVLLAVVPLAVVVLDQLTKYWITGTLMPHQSIPVIPGFFSLTLIHNPGAAFGLFADSTPGVRTAFLSAVSLLAVVLLALFHLSTRPHERVARAAALLVIGGAIGNLIDRVRFGRVVDFLDVYVGTLHWPAFNVADSAITVGISLFLWATWRDRGARETAPAEAAAKPAPVAAAPAKGEKAP